MRSPSEAADLVARLAWAAAALALGAALPACSCSTDTTGQDELEDAALVPFDAGPQPCLAGIRRIPVALSPLVDDAVPSSVALGVHDDDVLSVRMDFLAPPQAHLEWVDRRDGSVRASAVVTLPANATSTPRAIRWLDDGSTEILFADEPITLHATVVRLARDGAVLDVTDVPIPTRIRLGNGILGAAPVRDGFVISSIALAHDGVPELGAAIVQIRGGVATSTWLDLPGLPDSFAAAAPLIDAAGGDTVWLLGQADGVRVVAALDVGGASPLVRGTRAIGGVSSGGILALDDGGVIAMTWQDGSSTLTWVDDALGAGPAWRADGRELHALGVAGAEARRGLALEDRGTLLFGIVAAPGAIAGATERLADGLLLPANGPHAVQVASDGAFTIAAWDGTLSLLTFCEAP